MEPDFGERIARNVKQLRQARGLTQAQLAKTAQLPRATWTNLESGGANPTVSVLRRAAAALQVTIEELLAEPRAEAEYFPRGSLPSRTQGQATVQKLLPHKIVGMELERIELPGGGRMGGVPHTPGTREYLTCERGELALTVAGERWLLQPGDVVAFRGDQRHAYGNPGDKPAVGYSVVLLAPPA
jgi:XRE family transcriptional regulator, regulator of sulfur utilization